MTAWTLAITLVVLFWIGISFATWQINRKKLEDLWADDKNIFRKIHPESKLAKYLWKSLEAANPIFISQDSLGFGSLERFQILIFTTVVGLILFYIFFHSGIISNVSGTILLLLGVTVAGSTFARAQGDWAGISLESRRWLIGANILKMQREKPRWSDLFETQGEVDVAKIQALLFTGLISIGIFASGYTGLGSFTLPEQIVYLSMISQGAFVAGKLVPAESRKRLEEDLSALRKAAANFAARTESVQLQQEYEQSKQAAMRTLEQTYIERFNRKQFIEITADPRNVV